MRLRRSPFDNRASGIASGALPVIQWVRPIVCVLAVSASIAWAADVGLVTALGWTDLEPYSAPPVSQESAPSAYNTRVTFLAVDSQRMFIFVDCSPDSAGSVVEINPEELPGVIADMCRRVSG
jgi:hypothetical protein